jgi:hypothetical protein
MRRTSGSGREFFSWLRGGVNGRKVSELGRFVNRRHLVHKTTIDAMKPLTEPDWPRLNAALSEVMEATRVEPDQSLPPEDQIQILRFGCRRNFDDQLHRHAVPGLRKRNVHNFEGPARCVDRARLASEVNAVFVDDGHEIISVNQPEPEIRHENPARDGLRPTTGWPGILHVSAMSFVAAKSSAVLIAFPYSSRFSCKSSRRSGCIHSSRVAAD